MKTDEQRIPAMPATETLSDVTSVIDTPLLISCSTFDHTSLIWCFHLVPSITGTGVASFCMPSE